MLLYVIFPLYFQICLVSSNLYYVTSQKILFGVFIRDLTGVHRPSRLLAQNCIRHRPKRRVVLSHRHPSKAGGYRLSAPTDVWFFWGYLPIHIRLMCMGCFAFSFRPNLGHKVTQNSNRNVTIIFITHNTSLVTNFNIKTVTEYIWLGSQKKPGPDIFRQVLKRNLDLFQTPVWE